MKIGLDKSGASYVPLFIALLILTGFGLYYYVHVSSQEEYIRDRDLRQLLVVGTILEQRIADLQLVLSNLPDSSSHLDVREYLKAAKFQDIRQNYLAYVFRNHAIQKRSATQWGSAWFESGDDSLFLRFVNYDLSKQKDWDSVSVRFDFGQLFDPSLVDDNFDDILLVAPDGDVPYQENRTTVRWRMLDSLSDAQGRFAGYTRSWHATGGMTEPVLAGKEFKLFHQPLVLPPELHRGAPKDTNRLSQREWCICGLVTANRFSQESRALSTTVLIAVFLLLMLVSLSWPLLKVWTLGPHERPVRVEVAFAAAAVMLGAGLLTLIALDLFHLDAVMQSRVDRHLECYADSIDADVHEELSAALAQLGDAIALRHDDPPGMSSAAKHAYDRAGENVDSVSLTYPCFDLIYWADTTGKEFEKWSLGAHTSPMIHIDGRPYFVNVRDGEFLRLKDGTNRFSVEPHYSWTSDRFELAISMMDSVRRTAEVPALPVRSEPKRTIRVLRRPTPASVAASWSVAAMDVRPRSILGTLSMPGYMFCIVDEHGRVLFHSNEERNLRENVLDEVRPATNLSAALFARSADTFDASYRGSEQRVCVKPMRSLPWYILTFRDKSALWTMDLEILTGAIALYILFLFPPVLLLVIVCWAGRWHLDWVWPDPARVDAYRQLSVVYLLACIPELLFSLCNVLTAYWLVAATVSLLVCLTWVLMDGRFEMLRRRFQLPPQSVGNRIWRFFVGLTPGSWKSAYVVCGVCIILSAGVVPSAAFLKVSFDTTVRVFVRHSQLEFARGLRARAKMMKADKNTVDERLPGLDGEGDGLYASFFFNTHLRQLSPHNLADALARARMQSTTEAHEHGLIQTLFASYNSRSAEMRELLRNIAGDSSTFWEEEGTVQSLHSLDDASGVVLNIATVVPDFLGFSDVPATGKMVRVLLFVALFLLFLIPLSVLVRSVARRLFLIDVADEKSFEWEKSRDDATRGAPRQEALRKEKGVSMATAGAEGKNRERQLWSTCSDDEQRVLVHVALGGYVSYANRETVRDLQNKRLLVRHPQLSTMSDAFRSFLRKPDRVNTVQRQVRGEVRSGWARMRTPFMLVLVAIVLFLFLTQQEVLDKAMALMSVVSALLALGLRVVGMMSSGRSPGEGSS